MEIYMMETGEMTYEKVKEFLNGQMGINMMAIGIKIKKMVMEFIKRQTVKNIKGNGKMTKFMEKANLLHQLIHM